MADEITRVVDGGHHKAYGTDTHRSTLTAGNAWWRTVADAMRAYANSNQSAPEMTDRTTATGDKRCEVHNLLMADGRCTCPQTTMGRNEALATLQAVVNMTDGHIQEMVLRAHDALSVPSAIESVEPIAWMWQHGETGMTGFVEHASADDLARWERINKPRKIVAPLYRHPSASGESKDG